MSIEYLVLSLEKTFWFSIFELLKFPEFCLLNISSLSCLKLLEFLSNLGLFIDWATGAMSFFELLLIKFLSYLD